MKVKVEISDVDSIQLEFLLKQLRKLRQYFYTTPTPNFIADIKTMVEI